MFGGERDDSEFCYYSPIDRKRFYPKYIPIGKILKELSQVHGNVSEEQKHIIQKILSTRGQQVFLSYMSKKLNMDKQAVDNIMELLTNEEKYEGLLNEISKVKNLQNPEDLQSNMQALISFINKSKGFLLDDVVSERIDNITSNFNFDRFTMPHYTFREAGKNIVMRQEEEPKFEINDELSSAIFSDMPEEISTVEDKAFYIYAKLCKLLEYDSEYAYWGRIHEGEYPSEFSKEKIESIVPGSKVICQDFCRIYTKLINELGDDIDAVILKRTEKKGGHWLVGVHTSKVSMEMDSTDMSDNKNFDLANVKAAGQITGIKFISTIDGELNMYREDLDEITTSMLNDGKEVVIPKAMVWKYEKSDFETRLEAFSEVLQTHGIRGTELVISFLQFEKLGFFGEAMFGRPLKKSFLLRKSMVDGKERYDRMIYFQQARTNGKNSSIYCIDSQNGDISTERFDEIQARIENGELIFEDDEHNLDDFTQEK